MNAFTSRRRLTCIRLDKISAVDRPCQEHATVAIIKSAGGGDVAIRKNAAAVAVGEQPEHSVADFEDAMLRRADELASEQKITPEQALAKGLTSDRLLMDLAHATEVSRVGAYGEHVRKRFAAA